MSRKSPTFSQLIDYINSEKSDDRFNIYHNVYAHNVEQLKQEFEDNAQHLGQRKNGVYLYHEILSITRAENISEQRQKEIFCQIAQQYAQGRANDNMIYAGMHDDKAHNLHYHFVISANKVNETKRLRLSKSEFSTFKQDFEKMVLEQYPELEQKIIIQRQSKEEKADNEKLSNKASEVKRRTGKTTQREKVKETLQTIFEKSFSHNDFIRQLEQAGYDFYIRGKNAGVLDRETNKKYRLSTLGLMEQLEALDDAVKVSQQKTKQKKSKVESHTPQSEAENIATQRKKAIKKKREKIAQENKNNDTQNKQ